MEISRPPSDINTGLTALINTVDKIRKWMDANKLCINDAKTELIAFGLKRQITQMPKCNIKIGEGDDSSGKKCENPRCFDGYAAGFSST